VGAPFDPPVALAPPSGTGPGAGSRLKVVVRHGSLHVSVPGSGYRYLRVLDARGGLLKAVRVSGAASSESTQIVPVEGIRGVVVVEVRGEALRQVRAVMVP
jgi:hypothetical protein